MNWSPSSRFWVYDCHVLNVERKWWFGSTYWFRTLQLPIMWHRLCGLRINVLTETPCQYCRIDYLAGWVVRNPPLQIVILVAETIESPRTISRKRDPIKQSVEFNDECIIGDCRWSLSGPNQRFHGRNESVALLPRWVDLRSVSRQQAKSSFNSQTRYRKSWPTYPKHIDMSPLRPLVQ